MDRRLALSLFAALMLVAGMAFSASPDNAAAKQQQLDALKTKLAKVEAGREADLRRRGALETDLRKSERGIASLDRQVVDLDRQMAPAQGKLDALQRQQDAARAALASQKCFSSRAQVSSIQALAVGTPAAWPQA